MIYLLASLAILDTKIAITRNIASCRKISHVTYTRNANVKSVIDYALMTDNLKDRIIESETDENNTLSIQGKHPTDHRAITMTIQMKRAHKPRNDPHLEERQPRKMEEIHHRSLRNLGKGKDYTAKCNNLSFKLTHRKDFF